MSSEVALKALSLARVAVLGVIILAAYCMGPDLAQALMRTAAAKVP